MRSRVTIDNDRHRSFSPPLSRSWRLSMRWSDLLFAHWPVESAQMRPHIPQSLSIDTFDGAAWIGVVPFRMSHVRARWMPPIPGLSAFPELNVRTYVSHEGRSGVWFFSLDAANRIAVEAARRTFYLPYLHASMRVQTGAGSWVHYGSTRTDARSGAAELRVRYRPTSAPYESEPDSLESFLTDRFSLYAADASGRLFCGDIDHAPWPLCRAEAEFEMNTMLAPLGIAAPDSPPLLHFAERLDVVAWPISRV